MDTEKIIDYTINSPTNTNPNILRGMLNQLEQEAAASVLPDPSSASVGDVLSLNETKNPTWQTPSNNTIYQHNITMWSVTWRVWFTILTNNNTPLTYSDILNLVGTNTNHEGISATGFMGSTSSSENIITSIYKNSATATVLTVSFYNISLNTENKLVRSVGNANIPNTIDIIDYIIPV